MVTRRSVRTTDVRHATSTLLGVNNRPKVDLVSVLTPSFGYARFIDDAIESVLRQEGRTRVEHIVMDGESTDGTIDVLLRYQHLRWRSEPDEGQSDALNKALAMATGEVVGWLNADEFYLQGALETAARTLDSTGADIVYGDMLLVDERGNLIRRVGNHSFDPYVLQHSSCYIPSCTFFARRQAIERFPWRNDFRQIMDWDLYLRLSKHAQFAYVREPLAAFRVHANQVTATSGDHDVRERREMLNDLELTTTALKGIVGRTRRTTRKMFNGAYLAETLSRTRSGTSVRWWVENEPTL